MSKRASHEEMKELRQVQGMHLPPHEHLHLSPLSGDAIHPVVEFLDPKELTVALCTNKDIKVKIDER